MDPRQNKYSEPEIIDLTGEPDDTLHSLSNVIDCELSLEFDKAELAPTETCGRMDPRQNKYSEPEIIDLTGEPDDTLHSLSNVIDCELSLEFDKAELAPTETCGRMDPRQNKYSEPEIIDLTGEPDDTLNSLSDVIDCEPSLEFDDAELAPTETCGRMDPRQNKYSEPEIIDLTGELDDTLNSLSDVIECEPSLEFDDAELAPTETCLIPAWVFEDDDLQDPSFNDLENDGDPSESFTCIPTLTTETDDDAYLRDSGMVEVFGDDGAGRRIVVVSACRLPNRASYPTDTLFKYFTSCLDTYVEQDYIIIYFHVGLTSDNKPTLSWFWKAYKLIDRKFKKNLKALYVVYPTNIIKALWTMMKPFISVKFGKKVMYFNNLDDLKPYVDLTRITIPGPVIQYDLNMRRSGNAALPAPVAPRPSDQLLATRPSDQLLATAQYGVSLAHITKNHPDFANFIPPIVRICIEYLSRPEVLETEGLFRRSTSVAVVGAMKKQVNAGMVPQFASPHVAANMLKAFFKDLSEPLLTFGVYDDVVKFLDVPNNKKLAAAKCIIIEHLPLSNYMLLKFLMEFLVKVELNKSFNKMTYSNLSIVFGPNLLWREGQDVLGVRAIVSFILYIMENRQEVFLINSTE